MINRVKEYFQLTQPYKFDINDLTATIYLLCAVLGIVGANVTPLFLLGSTIGLASCVTCRKINLLTLNGALFVLNLVSTIKMLAICP